MSRRSGHTPKKTPLLLPSQRGKQAATHPVGDAQPGGHAAAQTAHSTQAHLPLGDGVCLVAWHPCGLYVLNKPEGILSHPNKKAEINRSLLRAPYSLEHEYFYDLYPHNGPAAHGQEHATTTSDHTATHRADEHAPEKLYLLHRLDSATSGLLLLADNEPLAHSIRTAFAAGDVHKTYVALCAMTTPMRAGQKGRWSDRLQREHSGSAGGIIHVRASSSGMSAVTDFFCRKTTLGGQGLALLELHPISGRTHQLRVHCAQHGLPILGDGKYGDFRLNREFAKASGNKRLFLHAAALELNFIYEETPLRLRFASPPPPEFDALLQDAPKLAPARPGGRQGGTTNRTAPPGDTSRSRAAQQHGGGKTRGSPAPKQKRRKP